MNKNIDISNSTNNAMSAEELYLLDAYWRACNYLAAGMIYLQDNPLLLEPLEDSQIKNRLLGHWGASLGLAFMYIHMNRLITKFDLNAIFLVGPRHGAPGVLGSVYLEGTYSEVYPDISQDLEGMKRFFKPFSFPRGIGSHCTPELPGSIHEGGELGYCVSHTFGAAFNNPDLIVTVVVGDGEAETGPLATSWHSSKFLNPIRDGAVLPILYLDSLFTIDKPIIFNFHGYPWLVHRLAYRRTDHHNLHVRGCIEQGNINTPLELTIENHVDRFSLAIDVINRVPKLKVTGAHAKQLFRDQQIECQHYAHEHGVDSPEMNNWVWPYN